MSGNSSDFWHKRGFVISVLGLFIGVLPFVFPEGRKCLGLKKSEPDEMSSVCPVTWADYSKLENLLSAEKFREADIETRTILQRITGITSNDSLDPKIIEGRLKCQHIRKIDKLWKKYSNDKFGLSVQREIFWSSPKLANFGNKVGWFEDGKWLKVSELNSSLEAPKGHWPSRAPGLPDHPNKKMNQGWIVWPFLGAKASSTKLSGCLSS